MKTYQIKGFTGGLFIFHDKESLRMWIDGARHALWAFAVNKDGEQYVGSMNRTFKQAIEELHQQYKETTGENYED